MKYYDTVCRNIPRDLKEEFVTSYGRNHIPIHRVRCSNGHTLRVLPPIYEPYKQYSAECIQQVIVEAEAESVEKIDATITASIPTIKSWKREYQELMAEWNSKIQDVHNRLFNTTSNLAGNVTGNMAFDSLRKCLNALDTQYEQINILSASRYVIEIENSWLNSPKLRLRTTAVP